MTTSSGPRLEIDGLCPLLQVFDMPTSVRFYCDILGFEIIDQSEAGDHFDWVWLRRQGAQLMLNTAFEAEHRPDEPEAARWSGHGDTALYFSCPDVDAAYRHLVEQGVEVEPPVVRDYGMKQVYLSDPDGYGLCFQCPGAEGEVEKGKG